MEIMTVNAFKLNRFTIDFEHLTVDRDNSEADTFNYLFTIGVKLSSVKAGIFCSPELYIGYYNFSLAFGGSNCFFSF